MKTALVESVAAKYGLLDAKITSEEVKAAVALALKNGNYAFESYYDSSSKVSLHDLFGFFILLMYHRLAQVVSGIQQLMPSFNGFLPDRSSMMAPKICISRN